MPRAGHGDAVAAVRAIGLEIVPIQAGLFASASNIVVVATAAKAADFGYIFGVTADQRPPADQRLPEMPTTVSDLLRLGEAMGAGDAGETDPLMDRVMSADEIPAGYTYFGQFVDHDITVTGGVPDIMTGKVEPLASIVDVSNGRTAHLELDSVYGRPGSLDNQVPKPEDAKMVLHKVSIVGSEAQREAIPFLFVPDKSLLNDLPRKDPNPDPRIDREALIGDARNDENLIIAQMHVAFLKAHNTLADELKSFEEARKALTLIYQSVIVDDYLPRICDSATLAAILEEGPRFFDPEGPAFMPLEFAAAAYRFGHSMVRGKYDFNRNFPSIDANLMFTFTALSGNIAPNGVPTDSQGNVIGKPEAHGSPKFPHNWIVQWPRFLPIDAENPPQRARPIDPLLTPLLAELRNTFGNPIQNPPGTTLNIAPHLAKRNLLRGYLLSLPTGEAVAARIGMPPIAITPETTSLPADALKPFAGRTPLWLYVLSEARANNGKLGVVGTTIVAETLIGLIKRSTPSIFDSAGDRIGAARHTLADIIALADRQDEVT